MSFGDYTETVIGGVRYKVTSIYNATNKKDFPQLYQDIVIDRVLRHIEQQSSTGQDSAIIKFVFTVLASAAYIAATVALLNMGGLR